MCLECVRDTACTAPPLVRLLMPASCWHVVCFGRSRHDVCHVGCFGHLPQQCALARKQASHKVAWVDECVGIWPWKGGICRTNCEACCIGKLWACGSVGRVSCSCSTLHYFVQGFHVFKCAAGLCRNGWRMIAWLDAVWVLGYGVGGCVIVLGLGAQGNVPCMHGPFLFGALRALVWSALLACTWNLGRLVFFGFHFSTGGCWQSSACVRVLG